ncbi:MAG: hypothetical protein LQ338_005253 [Usnochroma carphineum]|nr:MAG: hypothetical protein LQ338_005253 [Usnochroma carphineum]
MSAQQLVALGLKASNPVIQNYDKVYDPLKEKAKKQADRLRNRGRDRGEYDEEYVEYDRYRDSDRRRGDDYYDERSYSSDSSESSISPRRAYKHRKSLGEQALAALGLGGVLGAEKEREKDRRSSRERRSERESAYRREDRDRRYAEGSKQLPAGYLGYNERQDPRPDGSNAGTVARRSAYGGNQTAATTSNGDFENYRGRNRQSSDSSDSSSDVCSSSEDERRQKKLRGKEYLTAGLAAVATIHAAHGVYSSLEARDKRQLDVAKGEMAPEEAARLRRKAKLQDAAAIGIAALGIKGAYSEWQEVQEHRKELNMEKQERQKRHEKREKKRHKYGSIQGSSRNGGGGRNRSEPDFGRGYRDRN